MKLSKMSWIAQAASVLLSDPCFQLHSIQHLLGRGEASAGADHKNFSLHSYTDYITAEEAQKVEKMLAFLTEESKQAAATTAVSSESIENPPKGQRNQLLVKPVSSRLTVTNQQRAGDVQ
ncbi:hypothetical protein QTP70_001088 [Hemibagrus guttatus]|uniref:Uncharacterized protein n=1 Tax=Hemibagrus guttatus TaxID=175788 RepID=A0AAE0UNZ6_9TELE|nr:hypothetical protein QTP70_001088 [Hemibagrus guttatus]